MKFNKPRHIPDADFDLTAMIDVILLLIIFFMLTAQFTTSQRRPVDLPREKGQPPDTSAAASFAIDMDRAGIYKLHGQAVELDRLVQLVTSDLKRHPSGDMDVIIRADRSCPAAHLNRLANALAAVGVKRWKLATANPEGA
jgi:biopolymer transport protein ExbD